MSVIVDHTANFDRVEWAAWLSEYGIDLFTTHHVVVDGVEGQDDVVVTAYIYKINLDGRRYTDIDGDFVMDPQSFIPTRIPGYTVSPLSQ